MKFATFKDRAKIAIERGIPCVPIEARAKFPPLGGPGWLDRLITTQEQVNQMDDTFPGANCAYVAVAEIGGIWILETDSNRLAKKYKEETGKTFTPTFTVKSINGGHRYYLHNAASIAMGNIGQEEADGFSVRANHLYCLSPLSIHPSGGPYMVASDAPIVEADPEMVAWLAQQRKTKNTSTLSGSVLSPTQKIQHGGINDYMLKAGGILRNLNPTPEQMEEWLLQLVHQNCEEPIDDKKVISMAKWLDTKEAKIEVVEKEEIKLAKLEDIETFGMPDEVVPDCRLGEIFRERLSQDFPIDYGWISLIHTAGVLIPSAPRSGTVAYDSDDMSNFYTALVGPVSSGKTQASDWARKALGVVEGKPNYLAVKAGSAETLFENLVKDQKRGVLGEQLFVDVDELSHLFKKIAIDGASFAPVLTTGFYKKVQTLLMARGKSATLNCAMSWMGGIVTDQFEECFGSNTTGGLYDRFMFGMCPTDYSFNYRKFEGGPEYTTPVPVEIDRSVFEVTRLWKKDHPALTREIELAVRFAKVIASFDGRPILYGKDMEGAPLVFALEQARIREFLKPNAGDNPDAAFANAIVSYLKRKTKPGEWLSILNIKDGLHVYRQTLGPNVMERAINSLVRMREIEKRKDDSKKNGKEYVRLFFEG